MSTEMGCTLKIICPLLRLSASRPSLEAPCQDLATLDGVETVSSVLPLLQSSAALRLVPAQTNDDAIS